MKTIEELSKLEEVFPKLKEYEEIASKKRNYICRARDCFIAGICPSCGSTNVKDVDYENSCDDEAFYTCNDCNMVVYANIYKVRK